MEIAGLQIQLLFIVWILNLITPIYNLDKQKFYKKYSSPMNYQFSRNIFFFLGSRSLCGFGLFVVFFFFLVIYQYYQQGE